MSEQNEKHRLKKLKPLKDVDSAERTLMVKIYAWFAAPLGVLGILYGGVVGLLLALLGSVGLAYLTIFISDRIGGSTANVFYGMRKGRWTLHEKMEGTMNIARHQKRNKEFRQALITTEQILEEAPDYTEALFLKAQILWEGFGAAIEAKVCLQRVMHLESDKNATLHRWAGSLYKEITRRGSAPSAG